ncbi:MAG: glycosyltransferase [Candidatus Moranbacteria bacterium]|nr:glycosyltransferase [Candidatus Moranbacteria bacterium]
MHILAISIDTKLFEKDSTSLKRILEYANLCTELHIICYTPNNKFKKISIGNIFIYPTNSSCKLNFINNAYKISKQVITENNLTSQNTIITSQDPFETGLVGYLLKRKFKLGLNIQDHGNFFESKYWRKESLLNLFRYLLGTFILKNSNSIRTVSLREKKYIENKFNYNPEKISNFPIFTDWEKIANTQPKFNVKQRYPGFEQYLMTACRIEKVKNIPLLINSFSEILQEFPRTLLLIIGTGSQEKNIKEIIKKNNLQNNIIIEPWTNDLISYYKTSDIFVSTSFSEGWGLTSIEAAASNCPLIITDTGSANEFFLNQKNSWIIEIDNQRELTISLIDALKNKGKREGFAQEAFASLSTLPTKENSMIKLKESWQKAISK